MGLAKKELKLEQFSPNTPAETVLRSGLALANGPVTLACSFSKEDVALIDLVERLNLPVTVFALDTGRLPEETYAVAEALIQKYSLQIEWYAPDNLALQELLIAKGPLSFYESLENRKECCRIRKVEPLQKALAGKGGWITGLRREQGETRQELQPLEWDSSNGGLLKVSPLVFWNDTQLDDYIREHRLPVNRLYKEGYTSIGCAPCTRAIAEGEPARAGRWWWEDPTVKECGLHK